MSWLSNLTGIHIGSGPQQVNFAPPPEIANNPAALANWQQMMDQVNGTIGQARTMNTGAEIGAGLGLGAAGLGLVGGGAGAAGGTAGAAAGAASAAAPMSLAGLLGKIPGIGGLLGGLVNSAGGGSGLIDKGLGAAQLLNAANLQKQSTGYAKNAMDTANQSYDSRAPLRLAGVQGMLHPTPSTDLSGLSSVSAAGNPFAAGRVGSPMPLRSA